jgi:hypothetical protein
VKNTFLKVKRDILMPPSGLTCSKPAIHIALMDVIVCAILTAISHRQILLQCNYSPLHTSTSGNSKQIAYSQRQNAKTGRRRRRIRRRTIKSFSKPEVRKDSSERKTTSSEMLAIHRADGRAAEPQQL